MASNDSPDDIQQPPPTPGESPAAPPTWQADLDLPARSIAQPPRWPHPNFLWSLLWCILFLMATQIPASLVFLAIWIAWILIAPEQFPDGALTNTDLSALLVSKPASVALAVTALVDELLVVGFSLLVIRLAVGRDWTRQLALRRPGLVHTLLVLVSLPALWLLGNVAYNILHNVFHVPSMSDLGMAGMEEILKISTTWPWSFSVLVIGLGAGVGEELWCRGFLGRGLVGNYGPLLGVVAASFFFGLVHMDPCQGLMAMLMGFWLHYVYLTTRSLWLPMLLHFLNNALSVSLQRVPDLAHIEMAPGDIPPLVCLSTFLLLGATAYALYQSRARLAPERAEEFALWRPAWPGVEYPPPGSGTRVVHPLPSPAALILTVSALLLASLALANWLTLH